MKQDLTYIAILLDRSGSMQGSEKDVLGGVNTFLSEQRKVPGSAIVTMARFDTEYETIYEDVALTTARDLVPMDFVPRGSTALNDSLNRLITHVGAKLASMKEEDRPARVIFLVFSDGEENASKEVAGIEVKAKVQHQEKEYSWKFLFFGMGIDGLAVGASVGVKGFSSSKSSGGILRSARAASAYVGNSRLGNQKVADQMYGSRGVDDADMSKGIEAFDAAIKKDESKP